MTVNKSNMDHIPEYQLGSSRKDGLGKGIETTFIAY